MTETPCDKWTFWEEYDQDRLEGVIALPPGVEITNPIRFVEVDQNRYMKELQKSVHEPSEIECRTDLFKASITTLGAWSFEEAAEQFVKGLVSRFTSPEGAFPGIDPFGLGSVLVEVRMKDFDDAWQDFRVTLEDKELEDRWEYKALTPEKQAVTL